MRYPELRHRLDVRLAERLGRRERAGRGGWAHATVAQVEAAQAMSDWPRDLPAALVPQDLLSDEAVALLQELGRGVEPGPTTTLLREGAPVAMPTWRIR